MFNTSIKKTAFDKINGNRIVDKSFRTFTTPIPDIEDSISSFFRQYDRLFFDIPLSGDLESHEVLVRRSSEYSGFQNNTEEIDRLFEEIQALREENLQLEQTIVDLQIQLEGKTDPTLFEKQVQLSKELDV